MSSLRKKFSSSALKNSLYTPTKKWNRPSSSAKYGRKTSSPNLTVESSRKLKGLNILLKKSSPKMSLRSPESPIMENRDDLTTSSSIFLKKANSCENVSVSSFPKNDKAEFSKSKETVLASDFQPSQTTISNSKTASSRQDSGVGTPSTSSSPHTPLSNDQCNLELRFQYPNPSAIQSALVEDIETVEKTLNNNNVKVSESLFVFFDFFAIKRQ